MKVAIPGLDTPSDMAGDGHRPRRPAPVGWWQRLPRPVRWGSMLLALLVVVGIVARQITGSAPATTATPTARASSRLIAHGVVAPVSQARVGTLGGGVLLGISARIGENVDAQHELGRVRGPVDVEVLTAPFAGTITGLLAHTGDTLVPGAGVVLVADLTKLQVETTDVDEFLVGHIRPGQSVSLEIQALDRRELTGKVRTVALQPQSTPGGDQHYPVTIDLGGAQPDMRSGMSVRITVPD